MARGEVAEPDGVLMLSANERDHYCGIRNPEKKRRWLRGRLVAKHLFLAGVHNPADAGNGRGRVSRLRVASFDVFPEWAYRATEILPSCPNQRGPARLKWAGSLHPIHLSISHTSLFSSACLDCTPVGLDSEVPRHRHQAFYRTNFTASERRWAESVSDYERAYTLLWCLKESALKAIESERISLWRIPDLEVTLQRQAAEVANALCSGDLTGGMLRSEARLRDGQHERIVEVGIASLEGAVLANLRIQ